MIVYRIYNKNTGHYWESPRGRTVWKSPGHAKQSYNTSRSWRDPEFDQVDGPVLYKFYLTNGVEVDVPNASH